METVFITIHDLSLDARIKYCSDSVEDILGYLPHEVKGKSCWEYFHPEEIPFAQAIHGRGVHLDKAAALNYCRIKHKDGSWIGCECVFTVVYDVLVASTSIYRCGPKAQRRAIEGAGVRRIFSSSPRDPRYHMLSYISNKFTQACQPHAREPRAALFLNRFTRTSTIMFATNGISSILGLSPTHLVGKSFYHCIAENCLKDAIRCLESAKGNDSIAYLRFWFRDPSNEGITLPVEVDSGSDEDEDGGVALVPSRRSVSSVEMTSPTPLSDGEATPRASINGNSLTDSKELPNLQVEGELISQRDSLEDPPYLREGRSRESSGNSTDMDANSADAIFDRPSLQAQSSSSSISPQRDSPERGAIELEAVISCTSDGLIVVLRRANPMVPLTATHSTPSYSNGLFASPWATDPVVPHGMAQTTMIPNMSFPPVAEPTEAGFMSAIRDIAVFAWSLTGINGSLTEFAHGKPSGEAVPPGGLPVWDPNSTDKSNDIYNGFSGGTHRPIPGAGDPAAIIKKDDEITSSDDEIVWKRAPQMPPWRRPKRRGHQDAFGDDDETHAAYESGRESQSQRRRLNGRK